MSAAFATPPQLVIPAAAFGPTTGSMAYGPTGTPVVSPMPLYSPGFNQHPPPTADQLADPRDPCHCPRHDPAAGFTRNTAGEYGMYVPSCTGCHIGDREAEESVLVTRINTAESILRHLLTTELPNTDSCRSAAAELLLATETLEARTDTLPSPIQYGHRVVRMWETAHRLQTALAHSDAVPEAYRAHVESLDSYTPVTLIALQALSG
jgi:hypothetical protein